MQRFIAPAALTMAMAMALAAAPASAQTSASEHGDSAGGASKLVPPKTGEEVYTQVCQACHMADAKGGSGAATIPALANNPRLAASAYPITMVVKGRGAMPGFTDLLKPPQIAGVVGYVRTHFGNNYTKPVTVGEVEQVEASVGH